jgi:hypothetical protein
LSRYLLVPEKVTIHPPIRYDICTCAVSFRYQVQQQASICSACDSVRRLKGFLQLLCTYFGPVPGDPDDHMHTLGPRVWKTAAASLSVSLSVSLAWSVSLRRYRGRGTAYKCTQGPVVSVSLWCWFYHATFPGTRVPGYLGMVVRTCTPVENIFSGTGYGVRANNLYSGTRVSESRRCAPLPSLNDSHLREAANLFGDF